VTRRHHTLVTTGPYRWVRHPLYSVGVLFMLGLSTLLGSWLIPVLAIPAMAGLMLRTPAEEAGLVARFGDGYRAYMARTGRYLPRWG
ncbi:isoprenylcysteine carboxylmethyltransferase family protein, partial [bacterium]